MGQPQPTVKSLRSTSASCLGRGKGSGPIKGHRVWTPWRITEFAAEERNNLYELWNRGPVRRQA